MISEKKSFDPDILSNINELYYIDEVELITNPDNCLIKVKSSNYDWLVTSDICLNISNENEVIKSYSIKEELLISFDDLKKLVGKPSKLNFEFQLNGSSVLASFKGNKDFLIIGENFILRNTKLEIKEKRLFFTMDVDNINEIEFAFYIYRDNELIKKIMYQDLNELNYSLKTFGEFQIKYFIRDKKTKEKISSMSDVIDRKENSEEAVIRLKKEVRALKKNLKSVERLEISFIEEKKKKIELMEQIYMMLEKEERLLKAHKKILQKYKALSNSKLGRITLSYWKFLRKIKKGK